MGKEQNRLAAEAASESRYRTEVACKWGHTEERYTKSGACCTCSAEKHIPRDVNLDPVKVGLKYRRIAKRLGVTRYQTPFPCNNGHMAERAASDGKCVDCVAERHRDYMSRPEVAEVQKERQSQWRLENRDYLLEEKRKNYRANSEHYKKLNSEWARRNPDKHRQYQRTCRARNPELYRDMARRSARKNRMATPPWCNKPVVNAIYTLCPEGFEVDHRIPVKGDIICGLHVPENLQYLTKSKNSAKWNKWPYPESFDSSAIVPFSWEHFLVISEQA